MKSLTIFDDHLNYWCCSIPTLAKNGCLGKTNFFVCFPQIEIWIRESFIVKNMHNVLFYFENTGWHKNWDFNLERIGIICCQPLYIIYFPTFQYILIMLKIMMWSHLCKNNHLHRKKTLRKHLENFTMVMLSLVYKIPGDFYFILRFCISKITKKPYINLKYHKFATDTSTSD